MATIDLGKIKQVFRGTYNNATAYAVDDLVVFTDTAITSTYICTTASTGNNPSSGGTAHANWAYIAKGVTNPIPSQSGHSGKFLTTNGSALSFGTVADPRTVSAETDTSTGSQYYAFTGIDTSIKRFDVIFRSYSNNGANEIRLQLGNASGYATSGYAGAAGYWRDSTSTKENKTSAFESSGFFSIVLPICLPCQLLGGLFMWLFYKRHPWSQINSTSCNLCLDWCQCFCLRRLDVTDRSLARDELVSVMSPPKSQNVLLQER